MSYEEPYLKADLEEGYQILLLLQVICMHCGPLHHQADHPALVVQHVIQFFLFGALQGLGMIGAQQLKIKPMSLYQLELFWLDW